MIETNELKTEKKQTANDHVHTHTQQFDYFNRKGTQLCLLQKQICNLEIIVESIVQIAVDIV